MKKTQIKNQSTPIPVIFNHSAAIDDFVSTAVLLTMPNIELKGIVVTNADCIAEPAMATSWKVSQFLGIEHIPLTLSNARGWNSFPWAYRADCVKMGNIDILQPYKSNSSRPPYPSGEEMMMDLLSEAVQNKEPVTILVTGPFTTMTNILTANPKLVDGINNIIWMGGAIDVKGNLDPTTVPPSIANTHAEWNAFWDPFAVDIMFKLFQKIKIFPLDITDKARITPAFEASLKAQSNYPYSAFVSQAYAIVDKQLFYEMWNTCATVLLSGRDDIYATPETTSLGIEQWGFEQGWIQRTNDSSLNQQLVYHDFSNADNFYNYVLEQLKR